MKFQLQHRLSQRELSAYGASIDNIRNSVRSKMRHDFADDVLQRFASVSESQEDHSLVFRLSLNIHTDDELESYVQRRIYEERMRPMYDPSGR